MVHRLFVLLFLHFFFLDCIAWAKVELTMHKSVEVYLGDSAQIPCQYSFTGVSREPRFFMVRWSVRDVGSNERIVIFYGDVMEQLVVNNTDYSDRIEVIWEMQLTRLTIHNVQLSDKRKFFCEVNGQVIEHSEAETHLGVFVHPDAPVIKGVVTGISVTNELPSKVASCEVRNSFPEPNITWYKNNMLLMSSPEHVNVTRDSSGFYSVQSTLEYKVVKEDKAAFFFCEVSFFVPEAVRTMRSNSINVNVYYPATRVELWRESPQGLVKEGDTVELRCQGDGNPPPCFIFSREQDQDVNLKSSGDVLILSPVSRNDSGIYRCRPLDSDEHTEVKGEKQLTVHYLDPAVVMPKDSEVMLNGEDLTATCDALSSLKTHTVWYKDGKQVGSGSTLHLQNATYGTTGEYICEVTVPSFPALHTSGSVNITVQAGPQLMGEDQEVQLEEEIGSMVNLSCEAQGYPLPNVLWSVIGSQSWREVVSKSNMVEHKVHSVVSVKVTSDISARCNVFNDVGTVAKAFNIKAIGASGVIVVIVLFLLLLGVLIIVLCFLYKKGKLPCWRSGNLEIPQGVVGIEMTSY